MEREELARVLIRKATSLGACDAIEIQVGQLAFDSRTYLNCMFGCDDWGRRHTCPSAPGALKPWEYRRILEEYSWGILVRCHDRRELNRVCLELERAAFSGGHYFAFAFCDCSLCEDDCSGRTRDACRFPQRSRPSLHSVGIDVFATARRFGLPIQVLTDEGQEENWYGAVLVE